MKYFYVSYTAYTSKKLEEEFSEDTVSIDMPYMKGYVIIPSEFGFVPYYFTDFIQAGVKCEKVILDSCIEISEKEYEENVKYSKRKEDKNKPNAAELDEIERLVSLTEQGNLRVIVDENSEKPDEGLFNENFWDEQE